MATFVYRTRSDFTWEFMNDFIDDNLPEFVAKMLTNTMDDCETDAYNSYVWDWVDAFVAKDQNSFEIILEFEVTNIKQWSDEGYMCDTINQLAFGVIVDFLTDVEQVADLYNARRRYLDNGSN